jgi:hypothetical protein
MLFIYIYAMTSSSIPADALDNPVELSEARMYILRVGLGYCAFELYGLRLLLSPICQ